MFKLKIKVVFFLAEGSEDELELSSCKNASIDSDEASSMENAMLPPHLDNDIVDIKTGVDYPNNNSYKSDNYEGNGLKISIRSVDQLYTADGLRKLDLSSDYKYSSEVKKYTGDELNGYKYGSDLPYLKAREQVLASGSLPVELEIRESGVYAKCNIPKGTKYGPFQGKWAGLPQDPRFAWEVSHLFLYAVFTTIIEHIDTNQGSNR